MNLKIHFSELVFVSLFIKQAQCFITRTKCMICSNYFLALYEVKVVVGVAETMTCTVYTHTHVDITAIDYVINNSCVVEYLF